jgi:2'-5' RNA ligase
MSESAEKQRLFFALWPKVGQQQLWAQAAREWLPPGAGRLITAENLHLTLLFAGEVTLAQRQCLEQQADAIRGDSFVLHFDRSGYWRRPQVAWWGCSQSPVALLSLARALQTGAKQCGIAVDERPYTAHLTLARKVRKQYVPIKPNVADWRVDHFVLVRSRLSPQGPVYEVQRSWALVR